ncbi:MAG: 50S ribosomal protein L25 [Limnochordaceae bacterium]|nr:50S ribosomal protein L25 [Limnochordaceae bacterium]
MADLEIAVSSRTQTGKGAARKLRRSGRVPGSLYGPGTSLPIEVDGRALDRLLRSEGSRAKLIRVKVEGETDGAPERQALVKEVQRDPVSGEILHVDFYAPPMDRPVRASVPVLVEGAEELERRGLVPAMGEREIEVECLPTAIPPYFAVNVAALDAGQSITVADLPVPEGLRILTDPETVLVSAIVPRSTAEEQAQPAAVEAAPAEPERVTRKREAEEEEDEKER